MQVVVRVAQRSVEQDGGKQQRILALPEPQRA